MRKLFGIVLAALAGTVPRASLAASTEPIDVRFVSSAGCGSARDFVDSCAARTEGIRLRASDASSPVEVELVNDGEQTVARVAIRLEDGRVVERSLTAQSCEEALEAMAFVTALALDPESVARAPRREPVAPESKVVPPTEVPPKREAFVLRVGPVVAVALGATPSVLVGGGLGLELGREGSGFAPWLRVIGTHERTEDAVVPAGRASFERTSASVELCPVRLGAPQLGARLCGHVALGQFVAEGRETNEAERASRVWGAAGATVLVDWRLASGLVWSSALTAGMPWTRGAYRFGDEVFFETTPVVGNASSGLFLEFR